MTAPRGFFRAVSGFLAVLTLVFCFAVPTDAASVNIDVEIRQTRDYVAQNAQPISDWRETVMYSSIGVFALTEIAPYVPEADPASPYSVATRILAKIATGELDRSNSAECEEAVLLRGMQKEDGSFGDLYDTLYSVMALRACNTVFSGEKAVSNLLSLQQPDGSYAYGDESPAAVTGKVLSVLAQYMADPQVSEVLTAATEYLYGAMDPETGLFPDGRCDTYCSAIIGLVDLGVAITGEEWNELVSNMLQFKNDDYSYNMTIEGESPDLNAAVYALAALDAVGRGTSVYTRLMEEGESIQYSIKDYLPMITGYVILALLSLAVWVYILFFKGKTNVGKKNKMSDKKAKELELL